MQRLFIEFNSIMDLVNIFSSQKKCLHYLMQMRWADGIISPFDVTSKVYKCMGNRYRCKSTGKYFNILTGTVFENTKIPLQKWFVAIYLLGSNKKGISSHQLAREIGTTQKTAWLLLHKIRYAFGHENFKRKLENVVQADETFVGGKNKNRHADKKVKNSQGRSFKDKTPVLGLMQNGYVRLAVVKDTKSKSLVPIINQLIKKGSILVSDEWGAYRSIRKNYNHIVVDHSIGEYVRGAFHTNSIEGFWSMLKRGIIGIYHKVTRKHLHRYCDEFEFRFNTRKFTDAYRFSLLLTSVNRSTSYKQIIKE